MSHVGGVGCEIQGVCPIQELCAVIWEVYGEARCTRLEPCDSVGSHVMLYGGQMLHGSHNAPPGSHVCPYGSCMHHTEAIWGTDGLDPVASVEVTRQYIRLYSGSQRPTFGSIVAKERRCGACRRLVSLGIPSRL
jgi:hypothetical protein